MNWIAVNFAWDKISEKEGLRGKKEPLIDYIVPLMDNLKDRDLIEMWNHSFQKSGEDLDSRRIFVLLSSNMENTELSQAVRTYCGEKGLEEGRDFSINEEFYPDAMADFWGDNLETFARLKALSSTLAIDAMKENLGKNYQWHKNQNRPGHIWSNQLGCDYMEESQIYQFNR